MNKRTFLFRLSKDKNRPMAGLYSTLLMTCCYNSDIR